MSTDIPERLRLFLRKNINSVSLLDVLFLLKHSPSKKWTPEEVSGELRTNPSYALAQLRDLANLKLVAEAEGKFEFLPLDSDAEVVDELERLYNSRRSTVINFIYSQPIDSIRDFADAFKIKKD